MGDYSLVCAVSGLPVTDRQQVVGFELEPYRYAGSSYLFIPASWPVFGEYDLCGGIEGHNLSPNIAVIHIDIWNNAEMYWHDLNSKYGWNFLDVEKAKQSGAKKYGGDKGWTESDYLFYALSQQFTGRDEALVFRNIIDGKEDAIPHAKELCFLYRSKFMEIILQRILSGEWDNEQDMRVIHKIICLYSGQMITGKFISPSIDPHIEQYPDYKQRIKIMTKHLQLARKLRKEQESKREE
jgi:hypothetical protein